MQILRLLSGESFRGGVLSIEALTNRKKTAIERKYNLSDKWWYSAFSISSTFIIFSASLIFSRVSNIEEAVLVYSKIILMNGSLYLGSPIVLIFGVFGVVIVLAKDYLDEYFPNRFLFFNNRNIIVRFASYCTIIMIIILIGVFDGGQFIYFQY